MTTALTKRNITLGLALIVTIGLVVWVNGQDQEGGLELAKPDHGNPSMIFTMKISHMITSTMAATK